jgi:hypothetical protein
MVLEVVVAEVSEVLSVPGDGFLEEVLVEGLVEGRGRVAVGGRVIIAGPYIWFSAIASWITTQSQLHPTYD